MGVLRAQEIANVTDLDVGSLQITILSAILIILKLDKWEVSYTVHPLIEAWLK